MANKVSNDTVLQQLKDGTAIFELVSSPAILNPWLKPLSIISNSSLRFFARIGPSLGGDSPAMKKLEHYSVKKIKGDGRCLFRALVRGMASNKGVHLSSREETDSADELRMAVQEVICGNEKECHQYEEALVAITVEESLKRYCQRIRCSDFWGGESELLVLSKLLNQPVNVYITKHESSGWGSGFIRIAEYGVEFSKGSRKCVRLLYSGSNHYDLLI